MRSRTWTTAAIGFVYCGALFWAQRRRPLRPAVDPGARRLLRNGTVAAGAGLAVLIAERPVVSPLSDICERRRIGLTHSLPASREAEKVWRDLLAVVLMDYTLYLWHVLMHRWAFLYRLHQVHHADLDLDTTTALRFHLAEMLASVPWRAAQVLLIGTTPRALRIWQLATLASIAFHHSNIRLPRRLERILGLIITTPRLHGIHHSMVRDEQDSNWSNGLSIWDFLHGTRRESPSRPDIEIGVPRYRDRKQVTLGQLLKMPRVPAWRARMLRNGRAP